MRTVRGLGMLALIVSMAVTMQGCDFSALLGSSEDDDKGGAGASSDRPKITSYVLRAEDNDELVFNAVGTVAETEVRLVLPYSVINGGVEMTPTVQVSDGADFNPKGDQVYSDPIFYTVTAGDGMVSGYSVYADVDPSTVP